MVAGSRTTVQPERRYSAGEDTTPLSATRSLERSDSTRGRRARGKQHPAVVERHHAPHQRRVLPDEEHGRVAAVGVAHQQQLTEVDTGVFLPQFLPHKQDVLLPALLVGTAHYLRGAHSGHGRIGGQLVLDAGHEVAVRHQVAGDE